MPCYDERNDPAFVRAEAQREWLHNSPIAELLCTAMKSMPKVVRDELMRTDPKLGHWWRDHQARDAKRKRK